MDSSLTNSFVVDQSPAAAFAAICDVRSWWSGHTEGSTTRLGDEFTYEVPDIHWCKFRITELVPARTVSWLVLDSLLTFIADKHEWTGTTVRFDVAELEGRTQIRFTHEGLLPEHECFDVCRNAWGEYLNDSLRELIVSGSGRPNSFEGQVALDSLCTT